MYIETKRKGGGGCFRVGYNIDTNRNIEENRKPRNTEGAKGAKIYIYTF